MRSKEILIRKIDHSKKWKYLYIFLSFLFKFLFPMDPVSRFIIYNQEMNPYGASFIGMIGSFLKSLILKGGRMAQSSKWLSPMLTFLITPITPRVGGYIFSPSAGPRDRQISGTLWFVSLSQKMRSSKRNLSQNVKWWVIKETLDTHF